MALDGLHDMQALRSLYFRQKEEQATKYSPGREKKDYLDIVRTIPAFRPGEVYGARHGLTDRKFRGPYTSIRDSYTSGSSGSSNSSSRMKSASPGYAGRSNTFYKLGDQDEEETYKKYLFS